MEQPHISTIIPVYNGERFIAEALHSVLAQPYPYMEIIVVDDGSVDETAVIVKTFGSNVRMVHQENKGPAAARNTGLKCARGSIIAFLDADDIWTDTHIACAVPHIQDKDCMYVVGRHVAFKTSDDGMIQQSAPRHIEALLSAGLYKAELFKTVGMFNEAMRYNEDIEWLDRVKAAGHKGKKIDDVMYAYRRHEGNSTNNRKALTQSHLAYIRARLARTAL